MRADVADAQVSDDLSRGPPERGLVSDQREPPGIEVEQAQSDRQQNDPRRSRNTLPPKQEQEDRTGPGEMVGEKRDAMPERFEGRRDPRVMKPLIQDEEERRNQG